jgi:hypothetical protein
MRTQTTRTIAGVVNGDGTIKTGVGFTSRRTAVGVYIVAFPGQRLIGAAASSGAAALISPPSMTADTMQVSLSSFAGTQLDTSFTFTAAVTT